MSSIPKSNSHSIDSQISSSSSSSNMREFRILIASDIHLGYQDKSAERRLDSLNTFEELLKIGVEKDAHFVLFAGDLFHVNDPPKWIVKEAMRLLRRYCLGDREIDFRMISDQSRNFADSDVAIVNYEDPNINVSLPVFTIHGNHDDPVGVQHESVVKLLSTAGLLNYFGRVNDLSHIELEPLLFERGRTRIAIYGLGAIRDERLNTLFRESRVRFKWPDQPEKWFKIFVVHQNRVKRGPGNYLPESFLPAELDLVIWGHEHDCLIKPQFNGEFHVIQPGSTVATSLCPGEVADKHVGILHVMYNKADKMTKFDLEPIRLRSVRQLFVEDIHLSEMDNLGIKPERVVNDTVQFLQEKIEDIVEKAVSLRTGHPKQPLKPLVRLRVLYGPNHETFLANFVGRHFKDKIANPGDCILFSRDKTLWTGEAKAMLDEDRFLDAVEEQRRSHARIEDIIRSYFKNASEENTRLVVIHEDAFTRAIQLSVEKGNPKEFIHRLLEASRSKIRKLLEKAEDINDEASMLSHILEYRQQNKNSDDEREGNNANDIDNDVKDIIKELDNLPVNVKRGNASRIDEVNDDGMPPPATTSGRGGGRGRGRGRGRGGGRGAAAANRQTAITFKAEQLSLVEDSDDPVYNNNNKNVKSKKSQQVTRGRGVDRSSSRSKEQHSILDIDSDDDNDEEDEFAKFIAEKKRGRDDSQQQQQQQQQQRNRNPRLKPSSSQSQSRFAPKRPQNSSFDDDELDHEESVIGSSLPSTSQTARLSQRPPAAKKFKKLVDQTKVEPLDVSD